MNFKIIKTQNKARVGEIVTDHGVIPTPIFMPVGTVGSIKSLTSESVSDLGAKIILGNTYHLHLRPGEQLLADMGGLHKFMNWDKPILTDSGGFQVFSLGESANSCPRKVVSGGVNHFQPAKIDEEGVTFKSHLDGTIHRFTPEEAVRIQQYIGADIIMAFDECTPNNGREYVISAMNRTHRWLVRSKKQWLDQDKKAVVGHSQALFGIIQGGNYQDLRQESAKFISEQDLPGIAIGGVSIGFEMSQTVEHISWVKDVIPNNKPFYAMGVGRDPSDIVNMVLSGVDIFDCVAPTRLARNGALYHGYLVGESFELGDPDQIHFESEYGIKGRLQIGNKQFKSDHRPIQEDCDCMTCRAGYSRAYLRHLYKSNELLYYQLASVHNLRFMIRLCEQLQTKLLNK